ncbi:DnaJsubfamily C member 13 [Manis javanica]|nr:DnaJsubfamily C member 13 [Manis javanica]
MFQCASCCLTKGQDVFQRSILGHILPEAMVCYLENYEPENFSEIFLGECDTLEAIWSNEMRRLMIEKIAAHLADFTPHLQSNTRALYQYCSIPVINYPQLENELFVIFITSNNFMIHSGFQIGQLKTRALSNPPLLSSTIESAEQPGVQKPHLTPGLLVLLQPPPPSAPPLAGRESCSFGPSRSPPLAADSRAPAATRGAARRGTPGLCSRDAKRKGRKTENQRSTRARRTILQKFLRTYEKHCAQTQTSVCPAIKRDLKTSISNEQILRKPGTTRAAPSAFPPERSPKFILKRPDDSPPSILPISLEPLLMTIRDECYTLGKELCLEPSTEQPRDGQAMSCTSMAVTCNALELWLCSEPSQYVETQGKDGPATPSLDTRNPTQLLQASQRGRSTLNQITVKSPGAVTGKASAGKKKRKTGIKKN